MKNLFSIRRFTGVALAALLFITTASAQETQSTAQGAIVPRLIQFSGFLRDAKNKPVTGNVPITFSIYAAEQDNTPLWTETQETTLSAEGTYNVFLGSASREGLPAELFSSGGSRWLGVQTPEQPEQGRALLVSVPYALKAADADTLGGKPASAYLTANSQMPTVSASINATTVANGNGPTVNPAVTPTGSGTTDFVPLWTSSSNLGNSILFQSGTSMEVNGVLELPALGIAQATTGHSSQPFDLLASSFSSTSASAVEQHFRWEAISVGNNTTAPSAQVDFLYAAGSGTPTATGLAIGANGVLTFAPGQTFPGSGTGTITGVTAGTGMKGGGTAGNVTLGIDTNKVPQLNSVNFFTGNQVVNGNITASGAVDASSIVVDSPAGGVISVVNSSTAGNAGLIGFANSSTAQTFGVIGTSASQTGVGVSGVLVGRSSLGEAFFGTAAGVWGDTSVPNGTAIVGSADSGIAGMFESNGAFTTLQAVNLSTNSDVFYAGNGDSTEYCNIDTNGDLFCTGNLENVVAVDNGARKVAVYSTESPENWFEDFGSGQLSGGTVTVSLEATFAQTVNTDTDYHVFLTPQGDCKGLFVTNKGPKGFEVRELGGGASGVAFDYRVVGHRKGFENVRLADRTQEVAKIAKQHARTMK